MSLEIKEQKVKYLELECRKCHKSIIMELEVYKAMRHDIEYKPILCIECEILNELF